MSAADVDAYLAQVPQSQRTTLETVRNRLKAVLPEAQEVIQYGVPGFKLDGVGVAGYSASKKHCSYLPMSGTVLAGMAEKLEGFQWSKGALRFGVDEPLSAELLEALVTARLAEIRAKNA
jgi:uncharacterized protein YdhG (YjbR/CyaY superfamily)